MHSLAQLTDRDHTILGWLYDHKIMTTAQIATALFPSLDTAQERLRTLYQLGLLDRGRMYREGGGKHSWRYLLDHDGWAIVAALRGDRPPPRRDKILTRNLHLIQSPKTTHLLGVNSFFTDLAGYARRHPGTELQRWWSEWRTANSPSAVLAFGPRVRPDGHGIFIEDGRTVAFFLEYDTGTEPMKTIVEKLDGYAALGRQGIYCPVLFYLHSHTREQNLHARIGARNNACIATAVRNASAGSKASPADPVWLLHGAQDNGHRLQLSGLPSKGRPE